MHVYDEGSDKTNPEAARQTRERVCPRGGTEQTERFIHHVEMNATEPLKVMFGFWKGSGRLRVIEGPNDGDNRGLIGEIRVAR